MPKRFLPAGLLSLALVAFLRGDEKPREPKAPAPPAAPPAKAPARTKAPSPEVARLIEQLGDSDFRRRDEAERQLRARGVAVVPALRTALGHRDVEVRRRVLALIPALERAAVLAPRRVTLKVVNKPLRAVFDEITKQTGYKISFWSNNTARAYSFDFKNATFWEAIDRICKEADLVVQQGYGDDQLRVQQQGGHTPYVTQRGAFRFVPNSFHLARTVNFGTVGKGGAEASRSENLTLSFTIFVEPRMPLMNVGQVSLTAAYDNEKNSLLMPAAGGPVGFDPWGGRRMYYGGYGNRSHSIQTQVQLHRVSEKATAVKVLRGTVPVTLLVEQKPVAVTDNFLKAKGKKGKIGDTQFYFEDVKEIPANKQYQVRVSISHESSNPNDWTWVNSLYQRIELHDAKGNKYQVFQNGMSYNSNNNVTMTMTFGQPGGKIGPPQKFIFHSWKTMEHQVEFELRNLPLP